MSSISSSRKNRPTDARDEDYITIAGDFRAVIAQFYDRLSQPRPLTAADYWKQRQRTMVSEEDFADTRDHFSLIIDALADETSDFHVIELDENYSVPAGSKIRRVQPLLYRYTINCTSQSRPVTDDRCVEILSDNLDISQLPEVPNEQLFAKLKEFKAAEEAAETAAVPAPPPRRQAAAVADANCVGFVPGASLASGVCDASVVFPPANTWPPTHYFGALRFHLPTKTVVGTVNGCLRGAGTSELIIALYDGAGNRVLQTSLGVEWNSGNNIATVLDAPVTLEAGNYTFARLLIGKSEWRCLQFDREDFSQLNGGEGAIIVGMGECNGRTLPAKLGELQVQCERFPQVPRIFFKA